MILFLTLAGILLLCLIAFNAGFHHGCFVTYSKLKKEILLLNEAQEKFLLASQKITQDSDNHES